MSKKIQLTRKGYEDLKIEHEDLIENKKPKAIVRLSKARSMGDLSENSEYTAAKEELAFVNGRIQEIGEIIEKAVIVKSPSNKTHVEIGNVVIVEFQGKTQEFQIVGEFEADPMNKKLSQNSPIGQTLINKKVGDLVEVNIPSGKVLYKIVEIK